MPLLDGSHSSATPQPITWKSYTELHAGLLLGASLPPLLPPPSWGPTPSFKANFRSSGPFLLRTCSASPPRLLQPHCSGSKKVLCRLKKKPSWRSFCSSATQSLPSPPETLIMCPPFSPWTATHFTVSPFIPDCTGNSTSRLQSASNRLSSLPLLASKYGLMVLSLPFWSRWCWSVCHMLQMPHIQFPVLFNWSNCFQLHSWNLCPQARSRLVY